MVKRYRLKKGVGVKTLLENGFKYSLNREYLTKCITLKESIILYITVALVDLKLNIEVLDEDFMQYYTPFYRYREEDIKNFKFLKEVINRYETEIEKLDNILEQYFK